MKIGRVALFFLKYMYIYITIIQDLGERDMTRVHNLLHYVWFEGIREKGKERIWEDL